jgi:hypothetical protein
MAKKRFNFIYGADQLHPLLPLPKNHVVECPTDWLSDRNLNPIDLLTLLVMLAHSTPQLDVQISKRQIARVLNTSSKRTGSAIKRLIRLHYIRRLPIENGYIPIFRIYPMPYPFRKLKMKKPKLSGERAPSSEGPGGVDSG